VLDDTLGPDVTDDRGTERALERMSRGDGAALEELVARWLPEVERHLRRNASPLLLGRESGADLAQSVCREVLERLERGAFEYRGEREFRNWLLGAADLKLRQRWRHARAERRGGEVDAAPLSEAERLLRSWASPSRDALAREERERLAAALASLDERAREAVQLFYLEGLRHAAIAERLGVAESHSRTILARGLARLARLLRDGRDPGGSAPERGAR